MNSCFCLLEKLFDIARRVPFLAMTIVEKNGIDGPWLFRTRPLQITQTESMQEVAPDLSLSSPPVSIIDHNHSMTQQRHHQQQPPQVQPTAGQTQQRPQQTENLRHGVPTSTAAAIYPQKNQHQQPPSVQTLAPSVQQSQQQQQQRLQQIENLRHDVSTIAITINPKKVVKSSTAPNLPTNNSLNEMFRVI